MAELHQLQEPIDAMATTTATAPTPPASADDENTTTNNIAQNLATKRQRRPSVRLGEIGNPPDHRRSVKSWTFHRNPNQAAKPSKPRPLTNLVNGGNELNLEEKTELTKRKSKSKRSVKRGRTNWAGKVNGIEENNYKSKEDCEFRDFEGEGCWESPLKEEVDLWGRQARSGRVSSESRDRDRWKSNGFELEDGGVRDWLIGLRLGRYAPVFEVHEVDDEVLPMLTLEDLKDMGINAVGSRRKMYSSIVKLRN